MLEIDSLGRRSSIALVGTQWGTWWDDFIVLARNHRRSIHIYLPAGTEVAATLDAEIHFFAEHEICEEREQYAT
jgi:hypothetical protein